MAVGQEGFRRSPFLSVGTFVLGFVSSSHHARAFFPWQPLHSRAEIHMRVCVCACAHTHGHTPLHPHSHTLTDAPIPVGGTCFRYHLTHLSLSGNASTHFLL